MRINSHHSVNQLVDQGHIPVGFHDVNMTTVSESYSLRGYLSRDDQVDEFAPGVFRRVKQFHNAVAISGSQKTLMIGLEVALMFGGLAALPIITYHVLQLIADTMLVDRLKEESRG